jgi:ligand-binding sensor domain-containing protein
LGYALETDAFMLNRVPTKSVERTPNEIWTGKHSGLSFFHVWRCEAYVKCLMSDKLTLKSDKCFFMGYPRETKGYYFYNKAKGKVFVAHNGVFMEKEFLSKGVSGSKLQLKEIQEITKNVSASTSPIQVVQDVVSPNV